MQTPFDDVCYDEFKRLTDIVKKLQPIGMQYQSIGLSYSAFKESVTELTTLYESANLHENTVIDSLNHVSLIANRILGVLTSASAFLTSTEIRIKKFLVKNLTRSCLGILFEMTFIKNHLLTGLCMN